MGTQAAAFRVTWRDPKGKESGQETTIDLGWNRRKGKRLGRQSGDLLCSSHPLTGSQRLESVLEVGGGGAGQ